MEKTIESLKAELAVEKARADHAESLLAIAEERLAVGRWNMERDGDDILVCKGEHEKGEACEYERFVPVASLAAEKARADAATKRVIELARADETRVRDISRFITERDEAQQSADAAEASCERWRLNSIANHEAFAAMRNAINEVVPMQSAEVDLLQGPEQSVSCEAVAAAVVATISILTAERDALIRERDEARAALEPFSLAVAAADAKAGHMGFALSFDQYVTAWSFSFGDLRRARAVLDRIKQEGGERE